MVKSFAVYINSSQKDKNYIFFCERTAKILKFIGFSKLELKMCSELRIFYL